ncbi:D-alanine--D-alanine ligase family protein [Lysinibacillus sp. Bpr_S20]|uniref:D-alanine--D-alanine ligase family protein n=1 Tax=Lysinibacillus sp. Bpr_S20 TaxID=2933964 RepID=UPI0020136EA3|nr:D-alanine--D-alanine ligase family protein [Lysinibacillus sp. Bpr_S20]MCL1699938.1 D-alanine--D-alanine ligase [Lysinibacillus sp. Bpr_S20]
MILGLIYGGISTERNISINNAYTFSKWIDYDVYSIIPIFIDPNGVWQIGVQLKRPLLKEEMQFSSNNHLDYLLISKSIDMAIPLLNGVFGEDGTVQGLLETVQIPYTGNGVEASAIGMNKIHTKNRLKSIGIPTIKDFSVNKIQWNKNQQALLSRIKKDLDFPLFIKPARLGSSIGIEKVYLEEDLVYAIERAFRYDLDVLIEEGIKCREIFVSVLQNEEDLIISKLGEAISDSEFYSYDDKYSTHSTAVKQLVQLPSNVELQIKKYSKMIFQALNGRGMMRIDFFIDDEYSIFINEVNTVPSLEGTSLYPFLLKETGIDETLLANSLIKTALYYEVQKKNLSL